MNKIKHIFIIFIMFIFTTSAWALDYTTNKLPNGQTVIIYELHNNPIVTVDTWIKTGSINETDANSGVAHFLEHLFFKGTKAHPTGEFDKILESKGAIVNAATSKDFTHYYITIPSEYFDTALDLHSDMLLNPQIPRKEMEKERKVVLEEISKDSNTPSKKVYENLNELMYTHHPYKRRVIGSADIIGKIRREEVLEYFNTYYSPSNMVTVIVGDVKTQEVLPKIQKAFNQEYRKPVKKNFSRESQLTSQKTKIDYADTNSGYLMVGFRGVNIKDCHTYALDVLAEILGGGNSSKLYRDVKEQKGLAYSISAFNSSMRDDGIFYISATYLPSNLERLENAIFKEIEYIQKYGVTDEELERAKKAITQDTYYARESTSDISTELGYIMALTDSSQIYDKYVEEINKVSAQDIKAAAQKYLGINRSAISAILPKQDTSISKKTEKKHTAAKISENSDIQKYKLDNNATLLVNENKSNDIIAINIFMKGGEFVETKSGEATLAASTLLKGTSNYSSQELSQIMDENGIKISPSAGDDFFEISVQTTKPQLKKTMELLYEIINNPTFDDNELEKQRNELLAKFRQKRDIPMNIALENFKTMIFEGSVYSHTNKVLEKTIPTVTRKDVINYFDKITDAKNIIISINGNVSSEDMINEFGEILKNKNYPLIDYSKFSITKLNSPKTECKTIKDLQAAWLFMGWQTSGVKDKQDFVTLKVINTLLGSGMSSRLFRNLRESDGLAYQLGSSFSPKMLGGYFVTYIGTNPQTLDYSTQKINKEVERLKTEFVTEAELNDAKQRLKGGFIIAMETNSEKAENIGTFEAFGFGYDFMNEYLKMIDKVTASDILKVANKYFNSNVVKSSVK